MIYFTSDLHLGHNNIIKYCNRPFDDIHSMNKHILDQINKAVDYEDTLYVLGDFCFKSKKPIDYRIRINCKNVHLIWGNHEKHKDYFPDENTTDMNGFSTLQDTKEIIYCNQKIFLSHYPHRSWPSSHKGSYHLYGHVHSKLDNEDQTSKRKTLDVGVDNTINYGKKFGEPWSFKEIQKLFQSRLITEK